MANGDNQNRVLQVAALFLKLGFTGFGGTAANIALMEQEAVVRRKWLSREHFLDMLAVTSLVPGPNAVEMACHIGFARAGWAGLVAGGICFILPAFLLSLGLAWLYEHFGKLPQAAALLSGINPAVVAIILGATFRLGKAVLRDWRTVLLAFLCLVASLSGFSEVLILFASGLAGILLFSYPSDRQGNLVLPAFLLPLLLSPPGLSWGGLLTLGLFFLKVGSLLFGSGMLLYAFIQKDIVIRYGWLTQKQLLDAIAAGQITPGPVLSSATFIGYLLAGLPGALVSTVGVFLPSFVIVAIVGPWVKRLRDSALARAFLQGVNAAVISLIFSVAISLFPGAVHDWWTGAILVLGLLALLRFNLDSFWIVIGGGILGALRFIL